MGRVCRRQELHVQPWGHRLFTTTNYSMRLQQGKSLGNNIPNRIGLTLAFSPFDAPAAVLSLLSSESWIAARA